jgi:hypothetical protein
LQKCRKFSYPPYFAVIRVLNNDKNRYVPKQYCKLLSNFILCDDKIKDLPALAFVPRSCFLPLPTKSFYTIYDLLLHLVAKTACIEL